jgi:hypothetical protein
MNFARTLGVTPKTARATRLLLLAFVLSSTACERRTERATDTVAAAPAPKESTSPDSVASWTVDERGIGPVRAGMTLAELSKAAGETLRPAYDINETCDYVSPKFLPKGVSVMILEDSVGRVDVTEKGVRTKEGVGIGDAESRVLSVYGPRAQVQPHKYTGPTGHYVIIEQPGDTLHRIVFETDGKVVERYHAGRRPAVDLVEGCA